MKRFLGADSPLLKLMTMLLELAEINLLFLLCSVPVVTAGAAYAAMLHSLYELHRYGEGCFSAGSFFRVYKKSLKPLIPAWSIIGVCLVILGYNISYTLGSIQGIARIIVCGVYIVLALLISGMMQYLSFFMALAEKWNPEFIKNSFLLALAKFPTVILASVLSLSVFVVLLFPMSIILRMLPLVILFWCACPAYVCTGIYTRVLEPLFPELFEQDG